MKSQADWKATFESEIRQARLARVDGNEGMARVCARRAVGIVIGEYLSRRGYSRIMSSAYDRLRLFESLPEVDEAVKATASHFLLKVDHDRRLPIDVDLIGEAVWLAKILLLEYTD